jgi:predicted MFS family arabinose efflux permease
VHRGPVDNFKVHGLISPARCKAHPAPEIDVASDITAGQPPQHGTAPTDIAIPPASAFLITILTIGVGVLVANLYYAQPLIASIGQELHIPPGVAGSIVSVAQIGYGTGLFLVVPLADLVENKRLVLTLMTFVLIGLVALATSSSAIAFFVAAYLIGVSATGAQVLLPYVAYLVPEERRGRVVGNVMAGVLTGIMLARPASLFISGSFGWRAVFWTSACLVAAVALLLARMMPRHKPTGGMHYGRIISTMIHLPPRMPALCWRAAYAALLFGAFNMFWTAAPLMLAGRFHFDEHQIGLFALAGAGGALAAPLAGRMSDRDLETETTAGAMLVLALAFIGTGWAAAAVALGTMVVCTVLLDAAVQVNQVVSRRTVFATATALRGRVNALYMTATFIGGSIGSLLGTLTYSHGGWTATAIAGTVIGATALALLGLEVRGK